MNHAQLALTVLDDLSFYVTIYVILVALYMVLYRKMYWGLFDPLVWTVTSMAGGAFCVFFLSHQMQLDPLYKWSFLTTEVALFTGLVVARYIPPIRLDFVSQPEVVPGEENIITEFDIFTWVIGTMYIGCEIVSFMVVGIVLFDEGANHLSAFAEHGILMAFITSYRMLCPLVLFYKMLILKQKFNLFDIICWFFAAFGILTTGSKGAILIFIFQYFMMQFPLIYQGKIKPLKISGIFILVLACFPVLVLSITSGADAMGAVQGVFIRLLSSGDIFLLGYNDAVMASITEKSFLNYAFYPGWGTVLKNLGFDFTPPQAIGADILNYHYGRTDGGPTSRYNYVALHFLGFWGAIIYSGFIGTFIGVIRNSFKTLDPTRISYFGYILVTLIVYVSNILIDDINIFMNYVFWRTSFLTLSYLASKIIFLIIKNRASSLSVSQNIQNLQ
ncbi:hypothetical protein [Dyadobacter sp. NIV53]|uniref:hypothetical protein n=1 Tax=Dyadobacter sp. NIV53 TaxID=2861765 RepID=UPI001C86AD80|nr:hypothetical protein [Dyadobacter sp. NIV53]